MRQTFGRCVLCVVLGACVVAVAVAQPADGGFRPGMRGRANPLIEEVERVQKPVVFDPKAYDLEKDTLQRKVDFANRTVKSSRGTILGEGEPIMKLTSAEKEAIMQFLFLAETTSKYSEHELKGLLYKLREYKEQGRPSLNRGGNFGISHKKYPKVDAYVACLAGYDMARIAGSSFMDRERKILLEAALPECNRLSGSAHNGEENVRLEQKQQRDSEIRQGAQIGVQMDKEREQLFGTPSKPAR